MIRSATSAIRVSCVTIRMGQPCSLKEEGWSYALPKSDEPPATVAKFL
jgi:hypothetical protein